MKRAPMLLDVFRKVRIRNISRTGYEIRFVCGCRPFFTILDFMARILTAPDPFFVHGTIQNKLG